MQMNTVENYTEYTNCYFITDLKDAASNSSQREALIWNELFEILFAKKNEKHKYERKRKKKKVKIAIVIYPKANRIFCLCVFI